MQVFIVGTPFETAMSLDSRRLRKQVVECGQIYEALTGKSKWSNHPAVLQYKGHEHWLKLYTYCLAWYYEKGGFIRALLYNDEALKFTPQFHTQEYFDQMKRRLYTKDKEHYEQWAYLGESDVNWYWSHEKQEFIKYRNGKRI